MDSSVRRTGAHARQFGAVFGGSPDATPDGIPSVVERREPPPGVDADELDALVEALDDHGMHEALRGVVGTGTDSGATRSALFHTGAAVWRTSVAALLRGRCLDVNCGYGTRACLLAELVEEVYAVDPSLDALRFLARRDDYDSAGDVTPVHADLDSLPPPEEPFDTVVVDFTGRNRPDDFGAALERLRPTVAPDGVLLVLFDGWPRRSGLANVLGVGERTPVVEPGSVLGSTASATADLMERLGFNEVDLYALVPDAADPTFCFRADDDDAVAQLLETELDPNTPVERLLRRLVDAAHETNILSECYPSYLAACRDPTVSGFGRSGLVVGGSARSVILDGTDGELDSVTKVPNRRAHDAYVTVEGEVLSSLDHDEGPLAGTFPTGSTSRTRLGPTRVEAPVDGRPLSGRIEDDPEAFRSVLEVGFEWLSTFQRHYGGEPTTYEPSTVEASLSMPEFGIEPPQIDEPVTLFETPIHGDFHPKNVFVDEEGVSAVIDWELAAPSGNPVVDAGFFVVQTARRVFGGTRDGVDGALASPGPHADVVADVLSEYCESVGLTNRAVVTYLPSVWLHRLETAVDRNATMSYSGRACRRARDVRYVNDRLDDIERVVG